MPLAVTLLKYETKPQNHDVCVYVCVCVHDIACVSVCWCVAIDGDSISNQMEKGYFEKKIPAEGISTT